MSFLTLTPPILSLIPPGGVSEWLCEVKHNTLPYKTEWSQKVPFQVSFQRQNNLKYFPTVDCSDTWPGLPLCYAKGNQLVNCMLPVTLADCHIWFRAYWIKPQQPTLQGCNEHSELFHMFGTSANQQLLSCFTVYTDIHYLGRFNTNSCWQNCGICLQVQIETPLRFGAHEWEDHKLVFTN